MLGEYAALYEVKPSKPCSPAHGNVGTVTTLLSDGLRSGMLREALVVGDADSWPWAEARIARTPDEVEAAAGSKFTFVQYPDALLSLLDTTSAMVGLPCQIGRTPTPYMRVGLFCGMCLADDGMKHLLKSLRVDPRNVKSLSYRKPGGGLRVVLGNGRIVESAGYSWLAHFFPMRKCLGCRNYTNHFADISVGDSARRGWSLVLVRSSRGQGLLQSAVRRGAIEKTPMTSRELVLHSMTPLLQKERWRGYRRSLVVWRLGEWKRRMPLGVLRFIGKSQTAIESAIKWAWVRIHAWN